VSLGSFPLLSASPRRAAADAIGEQRECHEIFLDARAVREKNEDRAVPLEDGEITRAALTAREFDSVNADSTGRSAAGRREDDEAVGASHQLVRAADGDPFVPRIPLAVRRIEERRRFCAIAASARARRRFGTSYIFSSRGIGEL
jgi:hypothetical protein